MNWLDVALVGFIGFLTWSAWRTGFVRELVVFASTILAVPIAGIFYERMSPKVNPIVDDPELAKMISFVAILAGVFIAGQVAAHMLKRTVTMLNLGAFDKLAGGAFGFIKAVIICQVALIALVVFQKPDITQTIDDSPVAGKLLDAAPAVLTVLPARFDDGVKLFQQASETLNNLPIAQPTPTAR
jgi:membrane protein required for colicin V production